MPIGERLSQLVPRNSQAEALLMYEKNVLVALEAQLYFQVGPFMSGEV